MKNFLKNLFKNLGLIIYAVFAITITILLLSYNDYQCSEINGYTICIAQDKIGDKYNKGDLLFIKNSKTKDVNIGDEVLVYRNISNSEYEVVLLKVQSIEQIGSRTVLNSEDGLLYDVSFLIGKDVDTISYQKIGTILGFVESRWGYLFLVVIVTMLLFLQELFDLIMEIKYGSKEAKA